MDRSGEWVRASDLRNNIKGLTGPALFAFIDQMQPTYRICSEDTYGNIEIASSAVEHLIDWLPSYKENKRLGRSSPKRIPLWQQKKRGRLEDIRHLTYVPNLRLLSGVYFLVLNAEVIYVGSSIRLESRIASHFPGKEFDGAHCVLVPPDRVRRVESAFMRYFRPVLNTELQARASIPFSNEDAAIVAEYLGSKR